MIASPFTVQVPQGALLVSPSDSALEWTGRIDWSDKAAPVLIWQGTEMRCRFTGNRIGFKFAKGNGQACFNVILDDEVMFLKVDPGEERSLVLPRELGPGEHSLTLYKRTEAFSNQVSFLGLLLAPDAKLLVPPDQRWLRMEFYGDSITAGACNEDPGTDQYDDNSTHNHYRSYGAVTARNLGAEAVSVAISGIGICESWDPRVMSEIYDKLYVDPKGKAWDWSGRKPDIVVLNIGQNDHGFPSFNWRAFPAGFRAGYVELVRNLRGRYPDARFVCAIGGMPCMRESQALRDAFRGAVADLKASDKKIWTYEFKAFSYAHPRVDVHERMANELTAFIVNTPGLLPGRS